LVQNEGGTNTIADDDEDDLYSQVKEEGEEIICVLRCGRPRRIGQGGEVLWGEVERWGPKIKTRLSWVSGKGGGRAGKE